ncbi:hemin-degrading factor [Leptospira sp. 2 VSF19]|uniref:Hemin-degrading factor n=1 Tax=Leptospira soteropolitanensis TaxID=2950025 RepID=A0AAW5VCL2_9LEPT|nr:ChuX/HutX family heme-like substrate-binding protein [Leptospira soteropolitanensis]MCW7492504.1 hemin-degrading factor [Leptospira soteropolitanensis]MCW7500553.1 hemin-degrading factor [Leptospira soteropolitanensis]MCW7522777.1 hemin-degrading factor [Leptospira soteropolitanensis]MCW7526634.1 hemin-degrading factor [Leptospira soteropolitanensis]MCW7530523.1 hemin-degrading factor [Leptospira soteropolitanensis]
MNENLKQQWENLTKEMPKLRIRDAAKHLNVSEAELLSTKIGPTVKLLKPDWANFLLSTTSLGYVMALTRNESCVHERKGVYKNLSVNGQTALAVGEDIDLRIFLHDWKYGFYVEEPRDNGIMRSFQFFDSKGEAVHKIYQTEKSAIAGWETTKEKFVDDTLTFTTPSTQIKQKTETNDPNEIPNFLDAWSKLEDTHDFFSLLRKYNFSREFSLVAADGKFSFKISKENLLSLMEQVSQLEMEIMIFVGNPGMIQIHTGKIQKLEPMGPWFNVLDPEFNLHLRTDHIESVWIVDKPTKDGLVTSVEVFDNEGNLILQMFGKRKPGIPQSDVWYKLTRGYLQNSDKLNPSFV